MNANSTIQAIHLSRKALVYVRQYSPAQVREHTGSTTRQYDLVRHALELGWQRDQIEVIDQDQGQSGASSFHRHGFQRLVTATGLHQVGAVFCLEASRLARANSDWYRLLEICALTRTLVIDEDGIYDPGHYNDRLLLGFKGTMSEAELHWLHQRLLGGTRTKAQAGQLRFRLPIGYLYDPVGRIVMDPDEEVQAVIRLFFASFEQASGAMQVVMDFKEQGIRFPRRYWGGVRDGEYEWKALSYSRALSILHNPIYAGAYVYGRHHTEKVISDGSQISKRIRPLDRENWQVCIHDNHLPYVSWQHYQDNQTRLQDNYARYPTSPSQGAVREGSALLHGIVMCGLCGRRMTVRYGSDGVPSYVCRDGYLRYGALPCQSVRGHVVDQAVTRQLMQALQPAHIDIAVAALAELEVKAQQLAKQWELRLEKAAYEANLARRRFIAVEPENRLVARTLEADWNDKLVQLEQLRTEAQVVQDERLSPLSTLEHHHLLALAEDIPALWNASTTSSKQRKQLLRLLIKDVTLVKREAEIFVGIRWQTNAATELAIPRPPRPWEKTCTPPELVQRVRELMATGTDRQAAEQLAAEGYVTGAGLPFNAERVKTIRRRYHIPLHCPELKGGNRHQLPRGDGRYSTGVAAELLHVTRTTIAAWCQAGRLDYIRTTPRSPRWIKLTEDDIQRLRKPVGQTKKPSST